MHFFLCRSQGRRTSERFIKPAIPTPSLCLNTSAPNILSHQGGGMLNASLVGCSSSNVASNSGSAGIQPSVNTLNTSISSCPGQNPLNHSLSSIPHNIVLPNNASNPNIVIANNSAFTQPASPMDTSAYKD